MQAASPACEAASELNRSLRSFASCSTTYTLRSPRAFAIDALMRLLPFKIEIEFGAINVIAHREGGLTSLAFHCGLQQINDVMIIQH